MLDHDGGSDPVRLLLLSSKYCSCDMFDHDAGRVPEMPLLCRMINVTCVPLHVMPYQLQMATDVFPHPLLLIHPVVVV
jgi:hypothetical protein